MTHTVISTQDAAIAAAAGVECIERPLEISGPQAVIEDAVRHAMLEAEGKFYNHQQTYDYVVALQAAAPVRPCGAIDALLCAVRDQGCAGGVTMVCRSPWTWRVTGGIAETWWNPARYPRSQDIGSEFLEEINCIQVTPREQVMHGRRWASPLAILELPTWAAVDIDDQEDYDSALKNWPVISALLDDPLDYRVHVVRHDRAPSRRFPLISEQWAAGKTGIVLGNGPQIDKLSGEFWGELRRDSEFVSVGMNRICCAAACEDWDFVPTLHTVWDRAPEPHASVFRRGLARIASKSWRLSSPDSAPILPHDQVLTPTADHYGPPSEVHVRHGSADLAVNLLYRLGCRQVFLYGVEMNDDQHCRVRGLDDGPLPLKGSGHVSGDNWFSRQANALRDCAAYPGLELQCACRESRLVREQVLPYSTPDGLPGR